MVEDLEEAVVPAAGDVAVLLVPADASQLGVVRDCDLRNTLANSIF